MKKLKIYVLILISSIICVSCNNRSNENISYEELDSYYIFDTPDYFDHDEENNVLYIKSHKQLIEINNSIDKKGVLDSINVYNALGHAVSIYEDCTNPEIVTNPEENNYNITMHLHPNTDSIIINISELDIEDLYLYRCYMLEKLITPNGKSIFEFTDYLDIPTQMNDSSLHLYSFCVKDIKDVDFDGGERLILEYVFNNIPYSIPIPYQLLIE